jgi:metal-responsive CopG/Arc/MetJ family transcriptional regulator
MKNNKLAFCSLRLEKELLDKLSRLAKEHGMSRSNYIRQTLIEKINADTLLSLD